MHTYVCMHRWVDGDQGLDVRQDIDQWIICDQHTNLSLCIAKTSGVSTTYHKLQTCMRILVSHTARKPVSDVVLLEQIFQENQGGEDALKALSLAGELGRREPPI